MLRHEAKLNLSSVDAPSSPTNISGKNASLCHFDRYIHSWVDFSVQYARAERWKPPVDQPFPSRRLDATEFGPCCPQLGIRPPKLQDEQCLYLNIFAPLNTTLNSRLPVLFWIHGGGGEFGCSSQSIPHLYNGTNIIAQGQQAIIVTINYRLSVLAALFLEELARENAKQWPTSGNYHMLDIQSALRWVQVNIKRFGGDPSRVLVFGESAGANFGIDLGVCRGSENLYHHVISQSGNAFVWNSYANRTTSEEEGQKILAQVGCRAVDCLRNSSVSKMLDAAVQTSFPMTHVIDGYLFPFYPSIAVKRGTYVKNVGVTIGHNLPDLFLVCQTQPRMDSRQAMAYLRENMALEGVPIDRFDDVINQYRVASCSSNGTCCQLVTDILLDFSMLCSARRILDGLAANNNSRPLYWYRFECNPTCPIERMPGVCRHTSEIAYVFGTVSNYASTSPPNCTWNEESWAFSAEVVKHWISMATTGRPLPSWKPYTRNESSYYQISPYETFTTRQSKRSCQLADDIERKQVELFFGNTASLL